jgi:hypothetical protein
MSWMDKRDQPKAQAEKNEPAPGIDTSAIPAFLLYLHQ